MKNVYKFDFLFKAEDRLRGSVTVEEVTTFAERENREVKTIIDALKLWNKRGVNPIEARPELLTEEERANLF